MIIVALEGNGVGLNDGTGVGSAIGCVVGRSVGWVVGDADGANEFVETPTKDIPIRLVEYPLLRAIAINTLINSFSPMIIAFLRLAASYSDVTSVFTTVASIPVTDPELSVKLPMFVAGTPTTTAMALCMADCNIVEEATTE